MGFRNPFGGEGMIPWSFKESFALPFERSLIGSSDRLWLDWDEHEWSLQTDQDGDGVDDTHVVCMTASVAGAGETGRGGGERSSLYWLPNGEIPAYTDLLAGRPLDGIEHCFYMGADRTLFDNLLTDAETFTLMVKCRYLGPSPVHALGGFFDIHGETEINFFCVRTTYADGRAQFVAKYNTLSYSRYTVMVLVPDTVYYFAIWNTGLQTKGGVATVRPTSEDDFDEIVTIHADKQVVSDTGWKAPILFGLYSYGPAYSTKVVAMYFVMSNLDLFNIG